MGMVWAGRRLYGRVADMRANAGFLVNQLKAEKIEDYHGVEGSDELAAPFLSYAAR